MPVYLEPLQHLTSGFLHIRDVPSSARSGTGSALHLDSGTAPGENIRPLFALLGLGSDLGGHFTTQLDWNTGYGNVRRGRSRPNWVQTALAAVVLLGTGSG